MTLLHTIRNDKVAALKSGDKLKLNLLRTLDGEASNVGKSAGNRDSTDVEVISVIRKFIKGCEESLSYRDDDKLRHEIIILKSYLPTMIDSEQLRSEITQLVNDLGKSVGPIMKELKRRHGASFDAKFASQIITELM